MLVVHRAFLPIKHLLVLFLQQHYIFKNAYDLGWASYSTYIPQFCGLKGVYQLQWLSFKLAHYFGQLNRNLGVVRAPDPHEIINHIQEQCQWEPNLMKTFVSHYNLWAFLGLHTWTPFVEESTPSLGHTLVGSVVSGVTLPSNAEGEQFQASPHACRKGH